MTTPIVSICLPNLNNRHYLDERLESIFGQTYRHWQLVVSDNYSDDGAWELFENIARQDSRVCIAQAPRNGMYENWNNCIRRADGQYVYIATSDDSMAPDCLEKLVAALEEHKTCDLAHCMLRTVDEHGRAVTFPKWPECCAFADAVPDLLESRHIRRAPFDGLLHLTGRMVYMSLTELLIRRSLFDKAGLFRTRWGTIGDFNWDMRASLVGSTVHVPDTWATWRIHQAQSSATIDVYTEAYARQYDEMIQDAIGHCWTHLPRPVQELLSPQWLAWIQDIRNYYAGLRQNRNVLGRRLFQVGQVFNGTTAARAELGRRLRGTKKWPDRAPAELLAILEARGFGPVVEAVSA